jgi:hypothetical protein
MELSMATFVEETLGIVYGLVMWFGEVVRGMGKWKAEDGKQDKRRIMSTAAWRTGKWGFLLGSIWLVHDVKLSFSNDALLRHPVHQAARPQLCVNRSSCPIDRPNMKNHNAEL